MEIWYSGPQFRYERPQAGRYRQFEQVGVETLGTDDPHADVEVISLGQRFYEALGMRQVRLLINSLGDSESRPAMRPRWPATSRAGASSCRSSPE